MKINHIITEFVTPQAVAQDLGLEREKDVDIVFVGLYPQGENRAEDVATALEEVLPKEYPQAWHRPNYNSSNVRRVIESLRKNQIATVTTKPLSVAQKLLNTFQTYGIKCRIDASGLEEDITRRGFLQGAGAAAVAGTAGPAMAQLGKTKIAVQVGELDTGTQQYEPVNSGQARNFVYAYDSSVFIMKWVDSKGNNISEGEVFQARGSGTDFKDRPNTLYFSSKNAVKIVPSGSPEGDLIYFTPRNWIDQKIGWRSVYYQMFSNVKESVNHDINEGWTDTIKSNFQLPVIKKLMAAIEPYKNQVLQINNQAKKMQSQGLPPNEIKQFLQTNITSIGSNIANNTLITESEEFTKEEIAQLYKLISRQQWLTYLPLLLTFIYDQLKLPNIWGDRGVYWWAYAWWIIIAIVNELSIREKKKKLDVIGAKDPDQELMGRLDKIKEQGMAEGTAGLPDPQNFDSDNDYYDALDAYGKPQDTDADYENMDETKEKIGNMDADAFDAALSRMKKLAGAGPLRTVYDPARRVYRNVPHAVQPAQQPKKAR